MLKAIVEHVNGRPRHLLGHGRGHGALFVHHDSGAPSQTGHEERLVAAAIDVRNDVRSVTDDDHPVHRVVPPVAAAENRGLLAGRKEQTSDEHGDGCLAASSHRQVADAHDRRAP